eukprot:127616_1
MKGHIYGEIDLGDDGMASVTLHREMIHNMKGPKEENVEFDISDTCIVGKRFYGKQSKDRQFAANEFENIKSHIKRSANSNGACISIFYHDVTTHTKIEVAGGKVQRNASCFAIVGPNVPTGDDADDKLQYMWEDWTDFGRINVKAKIAEFAQIEANDLKDVKDKAKADKQEIGRKMNELLLQWNNVDISAEVYKEEIAKLSSHIISQ